MQDLKLIAAASISAMIGGLVMFIRSEYFSLKHLIVEIISALFVGAMVGSALLHYTDLPYYLTCSICALLGSMSSKVLEYMQSLVTIGFTFGKSWIKSKASRKDEGK